MNRVSDVRDWLRSARRVVALTGAGMSAESGITTFRGLEGFWRNYNPQDLATREAFGRNPTLVKSRPQPRPPGTCPTRNDAQAPSPGKCSRVVEAGFAG